MARVLDPKPQSDVEKQMSCQQCGALIAYVPNDIIKKTFSDYGGGSDTYNYVNCPNCQKDTRIK